MTDDRRLRAIARMEALTSHYAAQQGKDYAIPILLVHGASVDKQNNAGNTALHLAAMGHRARTIPILLEHGASSDLKNSEGETALDVAKEDEIIEMLREAAVGE